MAKPPAERSSPQDITQFLQKSRAISQFVEQQPRLMFAVDATASRQPTWDHATHIQQEMFLTSGKVASLAVQLCYYRGFSEFRASRWLTDSAALAQLMGRVRCEGGHTQIGRLLRHAQDEHRKTAVRALVFIGDAVEESPDGLCNLAGQCGILRLPLFLFQEGPDRAVEQTFRSMAKLSGGAYARFDSHSASKLADLLGAVASFAAGGRAALEKRGGDSAKLLLQQLKILRDTVPRLILLLAVVAVIYILLRRARSMPPHKRRAEYIKLGLGIALVGTVLLAATGHMNWVGAAFTALLVTARQSLPLLLRLFPMLASLRHKGAPTGGHSSTVQTALLRMQLDHDSGNLQGEVLRGNFQGWRLADMNRGQLDQFFAYCRSEDPDSVQLLSSYLQQRFPDATDFDSKRQEAPRNSHSMGRTEALAALGLNEGATPDEITAAHRKLIQKLHPDRGGNDYLAAQINQARDVLLG